MKQKSILLSFDIEEFDLPKEFGTEISAADQLSIAGAGTERILDVIEKTGIRATFFVTGKFAEAFPELIARMTAAGGEIASHGYDHSFFETAHLEKSAQILRKISGTEILGFRMARLAPVKKEDILKAGFTYESSLNPVWLPGRYSNLTAPLLPFRESCGLLQFPISAMPLIRFPLFWLSFKNLPLSLYCALASFTLNKTGYFNMYSHPFEYQEDACDPKWKIPGYITRHAGPEQAARLETLIETLRPHGCFITFSEWIKQNVQP